MRSERSEESRPVHVPVMPREVIELLDPQPGKVILDATVGLGGHSKEIVQRLQPDGLLIGLDRDQQALAVAKKTLAPWQHSCQLFHLNFTEAATALDVAGVKGIDGVIYDLGASQLQLGTAERGFSFSEDAPLDMRMDRSTGDTAADLLRRLSERELEEIIRNYGEERFARRIARRIVEARRKMPIGTTGALSRIIAEAVPRRGRISPQTRTFQALRIAVNHELDNIQAGLSDASRLLRSGGRLVAISFHSLEDRIVKTILREQGKKGIYRVLTKKPLTASREEVMQNRSSRSAKLRAAERTSEGIPERRSE